MKDSGVSECELFAPQLEPIFSSGARGAEARLLTEAIKAREDLPQVAARNAARPLQERAEKFDAAA